MSRPVAAYLRDREHLTSDGFVTLHPDAVLVHEGIERLDSERHFLTKAVASPRMVKHGPPRMIDTSFLVSPIRKRAGGLFGERIGVGRTRNNDITLAYDRVSKYHAYFMLDAQGECSLVDASSTNGTFVEGVRLVSKEPMALKDNSILRFAEYTVRFFTPIGFYSVLHSLLRDTDR